jgi:hypothetical protein
VSKLWFSLFVKKKDFFLTTNINKYNIYCDVKGKICNFLNKFQVDVVTEFFWSLFTDLILNTRTTPFQKLVLFPSSNGKHVKKCILCWAPSYRLSWPSHQLYWETQQNINFIIPYSSENGSRTHLQKFVAFALWPRTMSELI